MPASLEVRELVAACDLCGEARSRFFRKLPGGPVVRCAGCGLLYLGDRPSDEALSALYTEAYYQDRGMADLDARSEQSANRERLEWLPPVPAGATRRLLDVGCGSGSFLAAAREAGWTVEGTEISSWGIAQSRDRFGLEVRQGSVEDLLGSHWAPGTFDAVTSFQNIEHQRRPMRAFRAMHDLLKPGGRLVLRTPNSESFDQWWYGASWAGWNDPGHFYFFGLSQLERYCRASGLKVLHVDRSTTRALEGPKAFLRKLKGKPVTSPAAAGSVPQPSAPTGRKGLKRSLLKAAGYVASGRDATLLAERPGN